MEADIAQVKTEMLEFLKTVQFDKGDEVELVKFSDESYICASFTNDMDDITEAVNSMTTDGRALLLLQTDGTTKAFIRRRKLRSMRQSAIFQYF